MEAALTAEDPSGGALAHDVEPARVTAGPGETVSATVNVQARKALRKGEQRYRVCVVARMEGGGELRGGGLVLPAGPEGPLTDRPS